MRLASFCSAQKNEGKTLLRTVYNPENYEDNGDDEGTSRNTPEHPQHHTQHVCVQKSMPPPFRPRESNSRLVWGENKSPKPFLVLAMEPAARIFVKSKRAKKRRTNFGSKSWSKLSRIDNIRCREPAKQARPENFKTNLCSFRRTGFSLRSSVSSLRPSSVHHNSESDSKSENNARSEEVRQLEIKGVWVIRPIAQNLCEVTLVASFHDTDHTFLPINLVNANVRRFLNSLNFVKNFYERNGLVGERAKRA